MVARADMQSEGQPPARPAHISAMRTQTLLFRWTAGALVLALGVHYFGQDSPVWSGIAFLLVLLDAGCRLYDLAVVEPRVTKMQNATSNAFLASN